MRDLRRDRHRQAKASKIGSTDIEAAVLHHRKEAAARNQIIKRGIREGDIKNMMVNKKKQHRRKK